MEKTQNKYYKAAYILDFIFASLSVAYILLFAILLASGILFEVTYEELLIEYGGVVNSEFLAAYELEKSAITAVFVTIIVLGLISVAVMYVAGVRLKKFSNLTDEEANIYSGRALAWVVVSYFFGGLLIGGLATAGYCAVQNVQKKRYLSGGATQVAPEQKTEQKTESSAEKYSFENIEKMKVRLTKLKELKDAGALSEEEYNVLRNKVLGNEEVKEKQEQVVVDDTPGELNSVKLDHMSERLSKIKALKDSGAINDQEYEKLRDKIINSEN